MSGLNGLRDQISILGRAEYRYDRLISDFAEHYLELKETGYKTLPDLNVFRGWLKHLHTEIRPELLNAWQKIAEGFGFALGDQVKIDGVDLYPVRISCYPNEKIVRLLGFGVKKDGKHAQSSVEAKLEEGTTVAKGSRSLERAIIEPQFFPGSTRLPNVVEFVTAEISKL